MPTERTINENETVSAYTMMLFVYFAVMLQSRVYWLIYQVVDNWWLSSSVKMAEAHGDSTTPPSADAAAAGRPIAADVVEA